MRNRKTGLYISSTYLDLKEHRARLKIALEKAGYNVECMERYSAFDDRPLDRCLQDVANCDAYILVLAHRYGSRPTVADGRSLSITEREFEEATRLSRTRLVFCAEPSYAWPNPRDANGSADAVSLERFRSRVKLEVGIDTFTSPDNLASAVLSALSSHAARAALSPFPNTMDLDRFRRMASALLKNGSYRSKLPVLVAPLRLATIDEAGDDDGSDPIAEEDLINGLNGTESFLVIGDGGIGKTTLMLAIGAAALTSNSPRIPIYIDAPVWARSKLTIPAYLATTLAAQQLNVTAIEVAELAELGQLAVLINGWNEIGTDLRLHCLDAIGQLSAGASAVPTLISSRSLHDTPKLPNPRRIEVQGLRWPGQMAIIRAELSAGPADVLLRLLSTDNALRLAARNPLILRGLVAQSSHGEAIGPIYDTLGAIVREFESDAQRASILRAGPVYDFHREYLGDLASHLTDLTTTTLSRNDTLATLRSAAIRLEEKRFIAPGTPPTELLDALCGQHLLQSDGDSIRFAHPRFQEYFAASPILIDLKSPALCDPQRLESALNSPAWDDAVDLVAQKLAAPGTNAPARVRLVTTALKVDLGRSCELAARCVLSPSDDTALRERIVAAVNAIATYRDPHVSSLGTRYQLLSRFPEFADQIWPLLESESQQVRLSTHRLAHRGLSLTQLGPGAAERIATWPPDRRAELMHEIASNPDNYETVLDLARHEPDLKVRTAAIHALFWDYPASRDPVEAWLAAPKEVQTNSQLMQWIEEAMEDLTLGPAVRAMLLTLADADLPDNVRLRMIALLPENAVGSSVETILEYLRSTQAPRVDPQLVQIAQKMAPERLQEVACDCALSAAHIPEWAVPVLRETPLETKSEAFEQMWSSLQTDSTPLPSVAALAAFASPSQVAQVVTAYLASIRRQPSPAKNTDAIDREMWFRRLLCHVDGDALLDIVAARGATASYEESDELMRRLSTRMSLDGDRSDTTRWAPKPEAMRGLVAVFGEKVDSSPVAQDAVFVLLSAMASAIDLPEAASMLTAAFGRQLVGWAQYTTAAQNWQRKPSPHTRPTNPYRGNALQVAAFRCGPKLVPGLMALLQDPQAEKIIPGAIARALCAPWEASETSLHRTVSDDVIEGDKRRIAGRSLLQPTPQYQGITDAAGEALSHQLDAILDELIPQKISDTKFNVPQAAYRVRSLVTLLARIPSPTIVPSVVRALTSGLADEFTALDAFRALVRQGLQLTDSDLVRALEAQIERSTSGWRSHNDNYVVAWLCQLSFCVVPSTALAQPLRYYAGLWEKYAHDGDLARGLARVPSEGAWLTLLERTRESLAKGQPSDELVMSLGSMLTRDRLTSFFELLRSEALNGWRPHVMMGLDSVARKIGAAVEGDVAEQHRLLRLCIDTDSFASDVIGLAVLTAEGCDKNAALQLATAAVDSGRLGHPNSPTHHVLLELFTRGTVLERDGQRHHSPNAHNDLRQMIYDRADLGGAVADGCRRLLADIESARMEMGRPADELRHPRPNSSTPWTDVFVAPR